MKKFKVYIENILIVSKLTKVNNKKATILLVVFLSQIVVVTDVAIIVVFAALLANQITNITIINIFLEIVLQDKYLVFPIIFARYYTHYLQNILLKKLEANVHKNFKLYFLNQVFSKKSYSTGDAFFYINNLSSHVSFFYNNFSNLLNSLLQIIAYSIYLLISNISVVSIFGIGVLILFYPTKFLLAKARINLDKVYKKDYETNQDLENILDNTLLIKILNKEEVESEKFTLNQEEIVNYSINNHKYGIINSFIPTFFTMFVLSYIISFTSLFTKLTLDFLGVTLRLFQTLSTFTKSLNNVNNSQVHIEKVYEIEKNKFTPNTNNFKLLKNNKSVKFEDVSFKFINSDAFLFKNLSIEFEKNKHTIITGPNGSGKSTLLGLAAGVYFSNNGNVSTFTSKYGYIGPTPLIFKDSLYNNIMYGNTNTYDENYIIDFLKRLEVFKEDSSYNLNSMISNKTLSSGQMQKIAFVRALISDAEILLLDESTSNLDDFSKEFIFDLLESKNLTIINCTHDPEKFNNVSKYLNIKIFGEERFVEELS